MSTLGAHGGGGPGAGAGGSGGGGILRAMFSPPILLPWKAPVLASAAAWLVQRYGGGDMGRVIVALPASRAGRRLEELLLEACERRGIALVPPRITTVGHLPDLLRPTPAPGCRELPPASEVEQRLAWMDALRGADAETLSPIVPHPPSGGDMLGWSSLAESLAALLKELAGDGLRPADVAERGAELPDFSDAEAGRWFAIDRIYEDYLDRLAAMRRSDGDAARWAAVREGEPPDADVVVVTAVDLNKLQRATLDRLADRLTLLSCAPPEHATDFDAHGCLNVDRWAAATIPLDEGQMRIVDRPPDQAAAVVQWLAAHSGEFAADELTIGVCDEQVMPALQQRLRGHGIAVRHAAGTPITSTGPYRLLAAVAALLERRRFGDFATLIRHPDVGQWLLQRGGESGPLPPEAIDSWINLLDRYYNDHLQARLSSQWLGRDSVREPMRRLYDALHEPKMLGGLAGSRPPREWAEPIHQLLITVYGHRPLDRADAADRLVIEACERLNEAMVALHAAPAEAGAACDASVALRLVLGVASSQAVPPPAEEAAVELVGPLELPLDDAAAIVITGLNEGRWPQSVSAHPFLPDALRRHLGMVDNHRRHARDAYALSMILAQDRPVLLVAGRRDAEGNPLLPSRLLLADEPLTLAQRIVHFYGEPPEVAPPEAIPAYPLRAGPCNTFARPEAAKLRRPFDYLRVTDFKRYLECPYRFYLGRALELGPIDDAAMEMDGMRFGSLAHDVLDRFGNSELKDSPHEKDIRGYLAEALLHLAAERFGDDPLPAVRIQVEQLRQRLSAFAAVQARRAADGWVIHSVEQKFDGQTAWLDVDGQPMYLHGRIDRIDHHPESGRWAVLDYKTTASAAGPDETHRKGRGKEKAWVDLQLPLYRHLVRFLRLNGKPLLREPQLRELALGYVLLPARVEDVQFALAQWTAADLADADGAAVEVIRQVRAEQFEFNPAKRIAYDDFAVICGTGQRFGDAGGGGGGGEGEE